MIFTHLRALFACACLVSFTTVAMSDECKLGLVTSVNFNLDPGGRILIPVTVEGTPKSIALDTGGEFSAIDPKVANELRLATHRLFEGFVSNSAGEPFTYSAVIHSLDIGQLHAHDMHVLLWPSLLSQDGSVAGLLGADLLKLYDLDIDFGSHKLSLFSQNHCPGKVVYWSASAVSVIPIHVEYSGHIVVPVSLDSHSIDALLDTGASGTVLSMESAKNIFKLEPDSTAMPKVGEAVGVLKVPVYQHTFNTLDLEGISIHDPTVYIRENLEKYTFTQSPHLGSRISDADERSGVTDLQLGTRELRHLHLYIAYKEQKLYVTPASEPPIAATGPANAPAEAH